MAKFKQDYLDELADLLGIEHRPVFVGSSVPVEVLHAAAARAGVSTSGPMPVVVERIVTAAGLPWSPAYDSRNTPSKGGSTVTRAGMAALVAAVTTLIENTSRPGFLCTWNPKEWSWLDNGLDEAIEATRLGRVVEEPWSMGSRRSGVQTGDRVFLLKQGVEPRGIVASGIARGPIYTAGHWRGDGRETPYIDVDFDLIIDPSDPLPVETLMSELPGHNWRPQGSGTSLPPDVLEQLEDLWAAHTGEVSPPPKKGPAGQSRLLDPLRRRKVEDAAQARLMEHFEDLDWDVEDTRVGNPFDARATKADATLYLEAKGTTSAGDSVIVTRGEIRWAREHPGQCVMGIWSGIRFDAIDEVEASSGSFRIVEFTPRKRDLDPIAYDWAVDARQLHP